MNKIGLKSVVFYECVFSIFSNKERTVFVLRYVDDMLLLGKRNMIVNLATRTSKFAKNYSRNSKWKYDYLGCVIRKTKQHKVSKLVSRTIWILFYNCFQDGNE